MKSAGQEKVKEQIENHLDEREARWFAVYTRFRREKQVLRRLTDKGVHAYLPLQSFTRRYTRKVKQVDLPLINGYIFTRITKKDYVPVLETPDVVNFVRFSRNLISIPEAEINLIRRILGEGIDVEVSMEAFRLGDEVEVIAGQLTGLKGRLVRKENEKNFLVELETLGCGLCMYVEPGYLNRLKENPGWKPEEKGVGIWGL
ncbi:MAG: UpxY family transcription antiterminator [Saprospiraceae bacterium]|nr:UpxY family transcription antiterminator [Lewinella sp.]MCB0680249.1 UpxY family transcription antiterminator [Saprospiraceae bacterium]MCB9281219.1 UpxY family transcription antiterminator [Lewinellaceae bacterium]